MPTSSSTATQTTVKKRKQREDEEVQLSSSTAVKKRKTEQQQTAQTNRKRTRVVKLQRKNGVVIQDCEVYIGRAMFRGGWKLKKSIWANPYKGSDTLDQYREHVTSKPELMSALHELDGKVLGCWCKKNGNEPCHGDVLVQLLKEQQEQQDQK